MKKIEVKELTGSEVQQVSGGTTQTCAEAYSTGDKTDWKADVRYDF